MTDALALETEESAANPQDELSVLKQRARLMGIVFSNNISLDKLRTKVQAKQDEQEEEPEAGASLANPLDGTPAGAKELSVRDRLLRDEMKLVRLRITCMDPKKKDLQGEIFTIANEYLGTVRKFVPFGEVTEDGYHVPNCIYRMLDDRKFLNIRVSKGRNGQERVEQSWAKEFALEVLPPLTQAELDRLGAAQAAAGIFGND